METTAAQAFARLAEKVDLLEAAIAGLAAKRETMPDYSETLGEIAALLQKIRDAINTLARRPAMQLTPDAMAEQIAAAAARTRAADAATISQAQERMNKMAARLEYLEGTIATTRDQRRQRHLWGIGGMLAGILAWSILPGVTLRAMPQSWHMPESMAAHIIGEPTMWEAGARLMQADSPQAWRAVISAAEILSKNREVIEKCYEAVEELKKPVNCTIAIVRENKTANEISRGTG